MTREKLIDILRDNGIHPTSQRIEVTEKLISSATSLTADEIYESIKVDNPCLGKATVFRTLETLSSAGLVRRFERPGHVYAYVWCGTEHHHHLVCTRCHRSFELNEDEIVPLLLNIKQKYGFTVNHLTLDFYGLCSQCQLESTEDDSLALHNSDSVSNKQNKRK